MKVFSVFSPALFFLLLLLVFKLRKGESFEGGEMKGASERVELLRHDLKATVVGALWYLR